MPKFPDGNFPMNKKGFSKTIDQKVAVKGGPTPKPEMPAEKGTNNTMKYPDKHNKFPTGK